MRFNEKTPIPDTIADQEAIVFEHIKQLIDSELEHPVLALGQSIKYGAGGSVEPWICEMVETEDGFELIEYKADDDQPMWTTRISRQINGEGLEWTTTLIRNRWNRFSPEPLRNDLSPFMTVLKAYFSE